MFGIKKILQKFIQMKILHIAPIKFEKKINIDSENNSPEGISKFPSLANAQKQSGNYVGVISSSKSSCCFKRYLLE